MGNKELKFKNSYFIENEKEKNLQMVHISPPALRKAPNHRKITNIDLLLSKKCHMPNVIF